MEAQASKPANPVLRAFVRDNRDATFMDSTNRYLVQALFKDSLAHFTVNVCANDPVEAEAAARLQALRDLLIASVTRISKHRGNS